MAYAKRRSLWLSVYEVWDAVHPLVGPRGGVHVNSHCPTRLWSLSIAKSSGTFTTQSTSFEDVMGILLAVVTSTLLRKGAVLVSLQYGFVNPEYFLLSDLFIG